MSRIVKINKELKIGDGGFITIAGPCSIENLDHMIETVEFLSKQGIKLIRGGIFKPRTDPDSFQGIGEEGFKIFKQIKADYAVSIISEIMDPRDVEEAMDYIDIIQIGARNMQNYSLLKEIGRTNKPVMLKRGMSATINEWINAARYIEKEGNPNIILCERGIRTFETYTRNILDLMSIPIIKNETDYPIIIDPSHGTGRRELIIPASKAAKILDADGIMVEVHPNPEKALSDGEQSLDFKEFQELNKEINKLD